MVHIKNLPPDDRQEVFRLHFQNRSRTPLILSYRQRYSRKITEAIRRCPSVRGCNSIPKKLEKRKGFRGSRSKILLDKFVKEC